MPIRKIKRQMLFFSEDMQKKMQKNNFGKKTLKC